MTTDASVLDDGLTHRQEAVLALALERYPAPVDLRTMSRSLGASEGSLNVTVRSLQRRGLFRPVPARPRRPAGWTVARQASA